MRSRELDAKGALWLLRSAVSLCLLLFLVYSPRLEAAWAFGPFLAAGLHFLSNLALLAVPRIRLESSAARAAVFLFDIGVISWVIYASDGFDGDLYLLYFLVIFMSGLQLKARHSFLTGTVACAVYLSLWSRGSGAETLLETRVLLRLPFLYLAAFSVAFFAEQTRRVHRGLRERYRRREELRARRAAAGRLAAGVAAQMSDPLSVLLGFSARLARDLEPAHPLKPAAAALLRASGRLAELARTLEALAGAGRPLAEAVHLDAAVRDALGEVVIPGAMRVELEVPASLPTVRGDGRAIRLALRQLIRNAVEAMPDGGTLALRARVVAEGPRSVAVEVEDSGRGIAQDCEERILEPFFTTKPDPAAGLGLSLVSVIAERHGAQLRIERLAGGTRCSLLFAAPARAGAPGPAEPAAALARAGAAGGRGEEFR